MLIQTFTCYHVTLHAITFIYDLARVYTICRKFYILLCVSTIYHVYLRAATRLYAIQLVSTIYHVSQRSTTCPYHYHGVFTIYHVYLRSIADLHDLLRNSIHHHVSLQYPTYIHCLHMHLPAAQQHFMLLKLVAERSLLSNCVYTSRNVYQGVPRAHPYRHVPNTRVASLGSTRYS